MKRLNRIAFSVVCCVFASQAVWAQATIDTVKVHQLNEVVVKGVRAAKEGLTR